jgi:glycerol uptake facilitator-like aquaporin
MAVILFMGAVSGAHLNPAVSIAFAARGDFPWIRVPGYIFIQLVGATVAVLFLDAMFGRGGMLGATVPGAGFDATQAMFMEAILTLTLGLVSTILGTASRAQNVGPLSAVAVAGYIVLAGLWSSPVSGASMTARSFGPDLVLGNFTDYGSTWSGRSPAACWPSPSPRSCAVVAGTSTRWPSPRARSGSPSASCSGGPVLRVAALFAGVWVTCPAPGRPQSSRGGG